MGKLVEERPHRLETRIKRGKVATKIGGPAGGGIKDDNARRETLSQLVERNKTGG